MFRLNASRHLSLTAVRFFPLCMLLILVLQSSMALGRGMREDALDCDDRRRAMLNARTRWDLRSEATMPHRKTASQLGRIQGRITVFGPGHRQGSWVNLCTDNKGRLLVSDQFGGLYRIVLPRQKKENYQAGIVEPVPADIRGVNGMVWAFGRYMLE